MAPYDSAWQTIPHFCEIGCTFPGHEDPLQRQTQESQPGLIFWCGWTIMKCTLHVVHSLHTHK